MNNKYPSLVVFILLVVLTAAFGGTFEAGEWYSKLNKPGWNPPSWLFGPVWSVLYLMMAIAAWKVWASEYAGRKMALSWWMGQLILNAAWSWLFFGLERPGWAWLEMSFLILLVILCIRAFRTISGTAALLMAPYLIWLIFAWFLNLTIWTLNGGVLARFLPL